MAELTRRENNNLEQIKILLLLKTTFFFTYTAIEYFKLNTGKKYDCLKAFSSQAFEIFQMGPIIYNL